jgi:hypothetical protein
VPVMIWFAVAGRADNETTTTIASAANGPAAIDKNFRNWRRNDDRISTHSNEGVTGLNAASIV